MNNYEWQKQYTRQRIDTRLREAEAHRLANSAPDAPARRNPLAAVPRAIIGLISMLRRAADPRRFSSSENNV